jgi:hypothetical protein
VRRACAHLFIAAQNEPRQSITLNAWVEEQWCDDTLYWDPAEYGNQTSISVPHEIVWLPDTLLYNRCVRAHTHIATGQSGHDRRGFTASNERDHHHTASAADGTDQTALSSHLHVQLST